MRAWPVVALILVSAFWGAHAVVGQNVEQQLGPLALTVWRFTLGAACYAPWFPRLLRLPRKTWGKLALTGLFWAVLYPFFFYQSLAFLTPMESLLIINTAPLIAALLGWLVLREKVRPAQASGIAVAFLGVAWTALGQWEAHASMTGIALVLVAAASFAAYTVASRSLAKELSLLDMVAATSVAGALELWIIVALSGQGAAIAQSLRRLNMQGWAEFLYVVLIVSTVAYILYGYGLKRLPSAVTSALTFYPQIVFAALLQWIWLGLPPTRNVILSAALILGGVLIMQFSPRRRATPAPKEQ